VPDTTLQRSPADEIRSKLAAKVATIKNRRDLSAEGRARQLAKAYVAARTEMTKLRQKDTERTERRRTELQQRLFGKPEKLGFNYRHLFQRCSRSSRQTKRRARSCRVTCALSP
jgi:hypothetical protein